MSELPNLLRDAVVVNSHDRTVALMYSAGVDSVTVGLAAEAAGKSVRGYVFHLEGYSSKDLRKAMTIAGHYGWPLTIVTVPSRDAAVFIRLAVEQQCRKKVQFEVSYPMSFLLPAIAEREVLTGFNADDHFGNNRECIFRQSRLARAGQSAAERKKAFDAERKAQFENELVNPESDTLGGMRVVLLSSTGKN